MGLGVRLGAALVVGLALAFDAAASQAIADPCKAVPDRGPAPAYAGRVVYVGDGDSLCVATGQGPKGWVEVRIADFFAPELHEAGGEAAKATLARLAYGRWATCVADHQSYDRIVAACRIGGRDLGDMLRAAGAVEGGRAYGGASRAIGRRLRTQTAAAPAREAEDAPAAYRNCAAARAAGAAPLYRGDPGYSPRLDRDADGVACEPYRPRR